MSTLQTLLAVAVLIYVLCVIVQGIQEIVKSLLNTKAKIMSATINRFMCDHLTLDQVCDALKKRGMDITDLERFSKSDFRHLLDGIELAEPQVKGLLAPSVVQAAGSAQEMIDQAKDHIAGVYDAARLQFQKSYTSQNKKWVIALSFLVVVVMNSNIIMLYNEVSADQIMSQAIAGKADNAVPKTCLPSRANVPQSELATTYSANRDCIKVALQSYPVLARWSAEQWKEDWNESKFQTIFGLLVMGILVSLGAPFWNDILKGVTGFNNTLNALPREKNLDSR